MATAPAFASTPRFETSRGNTANTNHDGTGTVTALITGAAAGTKVTAIVAIAEVTTTAGMIRIYSSTDGGTTWRLFDELPVIAITVSASQVGVRVRKEYPDLVLRSATHLLGWSTHNAEMFVVHALAGDLT